MLPPLYSGHFEKSQNNFNSRFPLKWGHPSSQDSLIGPKVEGVHRKTQYNCKGGKLLAPQKHDQLKGHA